MKLLIVIFSSLLLSACSTDLNEDALMYSFQTIEYGHKPNETNNIEMTIAEENEIFTRAELQELTLNLDIVNLSEATLEIGSHLEIEKFKDGRWEEVEPAEDSTEEAVLIAIPPGNSFEQKLPISERLLNTDDLIGGTYRLNNNDAFYTYLTIGEFSSE